MSTLFAILSLKQKGKEVVILKSEEWFPFTAGRRGVRRGGRRGADSVSFLTPGGWFHGCLLCDQSRN